MLREGVTIDEIGRRHRLAGAHGAGRHGRPPEKRLGLTIASDKEERGRVYRVVD